MNVLALPAKEQAEKINVEIKEVINITTT